MYTQTVKPLLSGRKQILGPSTEMDCPDVNIWLYLMQHVRPNWHLYWLFVQTPDKRPIGLLLLSEHVDDAFAKVKTHRSQTLIPNGLPTDWPYYSGTRDPWSKVYFSSKPWRCLGHSTWVNYSPLNSLSMTYQRTILRVALYMKQLNVTHTCTLSTAFQS